MRREMLKLSRVALFALAAVGSLAASRASAEGEQFIGLPTYRVGPYAAGGSGIFGGWIDYMTLINEREGGINGVKLVWEECETEYNTARGVECYERLKMRGTTGNTVFHPNSTGITYAVLDKAAQDKIPLVTTFWSQSTTKIKFIGSREGGMDKLKGKSIANVYHDSAYGKETIPILDAQAKKYGFTVTHVAVTPPGLEQQSQWLQVRQLKPDWVILRGFGVMNPTALKAAAKVGFPREKIVGVWWSGAEEDVIPAGDAAKVYI